MAFEDSSDALECPACHAHHDVRWQRMPVRERITIPCQACGGTLFQGNTVRDYYSVTLRVDPAS